MAKKPASKKPGPEEEPADTQDEGTGEADPTQCLIDEVEAECADCGVEVKAKTAGKVGAGEVGGIIEELALPIFLMLLKWWQSRKGQ